MIVIAPRRIHVPVALHKALAEWPVSGAELTQVDDETWVTRRPIAMHQDSTAAGMVTYGAVLVNEPGYLLFYDGRCWDLPEGTIYRIDGRLPHGTFHRGAGTDGPFAFLAWDMPTEWGLDEFCLELDLALISKNYRHPSDRRPISKIAHVER